MLKLRLRTATGLGAMLIALTAIVGLATAGDTQKFPTEVLNEGYFEQDGQEDRIQGAVVAPKRACVLGRRVEVFERRVDGPPLKLGTAFADSYEHWTLRGPIVLSQTGDFFAKAKKLRLRNGDICKPDRSPTLHVEF